VKKTKRNRHGIFSNLKYDLPASIVVFFVALPLCLGIALASGAPLLSGLIAGVVGGIVVGAISKSSLGVSGPAAGLAVIVLTAITELGSFEAFLVSGVIAGVIQMLFGIIKAGKVAMLFPSSVISGMLAGIGIIILLKQIPLLIGYDANVEGDFSFFRTDEETALSGFGNVFQIFSPGVLLISGISLLILVGWQSKMIRSNRLLSIIPGPLLVVVIGVGLANLIELVPTISISADHFVNIPIEDGWGDMREHFSTPNWSYITNGEVWTVAIVIAVVASIETLLCVEATDKLDPHYKHNTPVNRELIAQGIGNVVACLIGGIPVTQVIVRSSANIHAGGKTKMSTIIHGILLLVAVLLIPLLLNMIPIAALASVLALVGYKLAAPATFKRLYKEGWVQFIPFIATVVFMLFTNLLTGVVIGFAISSIFILHKNYSNFMEVSSTIVEGKPMMKISLINNVTFLSKSKLMSQFNKAAYHSRVIIDTRKAHYIHPDIYAMMLEFEILALHKQIRYEVINHELQIENTHANSKT